MRRRPILPVLLFLAACAHGEAFEAGVLRKGDVSVHIGALPSGWRRVAVDGADLAFRDDARGASTLFDFRCGHRDDDAPLSVLTDHLVMGTTERHFDSQEVIPFDGREAMHTLMRAKLDGVPMQYDVYVLKKDGCVFDIVYVASPETFALGSEDFERFALATHALPSRPTALGQRTGAPADDP